MRPRSHRHTLCCCEDRGLVHRGHLRAQRAGPRHVGPHGQPPAGIGRGARSDSSRRSGAWARRPRVSARPEARRAQQRCRARAGHLGALDPHVRGRHVGLRLGPVIFGDGTALPDRWGVRASGTVVTRAPPSSSSLSRLRSTWETPMRTPRAPEPPTPDHHAGVRRGSASLLDRDPASPGPRSPVRGDTTSSAPRAATRGGSRSRARATGSRPTRTRVSTRRRRTSTGCSSCSRTGPPRHRPTWCRPRPSVDPPAPTVLRVPSKTRYHDRPRLGRRRRRGQLPGRTIGRRRDRVEHDRHERSGRHHVHGCRSRTETTYFYRVVATNEGGSSAPSNVVSETTKKGASDGDVIEGDGSLGGVEAVEVDAGAAGRRVESRSGDGGGRGAERRGRHSGRGVERRAEADAIAG